MRERSVAPSAGMTGSDSSANAESQSHGGQPRHPRNLFAQSGLWLALSLSDSLGSVQSHDRHMTS